MVLEKGHSVINIDMITYASNLKINDEFKKKYSDRYTFIKEDISDLKELPFCNVIVHFAAESHVDNSIESPDQFIKDRLCLCVFGLAVGA